MDYIKHYKEVTKIDFDSNKYEIHHIDGNRENNNIENLVALPKELHQQYHKRLSSVLRLLDTKGNIKPTLEIKSMNDIGSGYNLYMLDELIKFIKIQSECSKYCDYRDYLLNRFSENIHKLNYN